jgi:hypothetical protein
MLLIHGARSVLCRATSKNDNRHRWTAEKAKTCFAAANSNARMIWALLASDEPSPPRREKKEYVSTGLQRR